MNKKIVLICLLIPSLYAMPSCENVSQVNQKINADNNKSEPIHSTLPVGAAYNSLLGRVSYISISKASINLGLNDHISLEASVVLTEKGTDRNVIWQSSDSSIVSVDSYGQVKSYDTIGKAKITVISREEPSKSTSIDAVVSKKEAVTEQPSVLLSIPPSQDQTLNKVDVIASIQPVSAPVGKKTDNITPGFHTGTPVPVKSGSINNNTASQNAFLIAVPNPNQNSDDQGTFFLPNDPTNKSIQDKSVFISPIDKTLKDGSQFVLVTPISTPTPSK
ncbi:MAG: Ig-like domain-containing protein [Candidatus Sericytochromatia bacterium]|nr:Ig-like domain-containing protein [Candidatus Sericytochromatia bacterium]